MQPEEPQLLQEPPLPDIGVLNPDPSLENEQQTEITRLALFLHLGQEASLFDSLSERNNSNLLPQSEQTYSYIGIFSSPNYNFRVFQVVSQADVLKVF